MKEYTFDQLELGMSASFTKKVEEREMTQFSNITSDLNPLHIDEMYAKSQGFEKKVVYGLLVSSFLSTIAGMHLPGKYSLIMKVESNMKKPAFVGDTLKISGKIVKKIEFGKIIIIDTMIENQKDEIVQQGTMHVKVLK